MSFNSSTTAGSREDSLSWRENVFDTILSQQNWFSEEEIFFLFYDFFRSSLSAWTDLWKISVKNSFVAGCIKSFMVRHAYTIRWSMPVYCHWYNDDDDDDASLTRTGKVRLLVQSMTKTPHFILYSEHTIILCNLIL